MNIRTQISSSSIVAAPKKIKGANLIIHRHVQWRFFVTGLIISDLVMTFAAFWLAYYFRFEWFVQYFVPNGNGMVSFETYRFLLYSMPLLWLGIFAVNGLYAKDNLLG